MSVGDLCWGVWGIGRRCGCEKRRQREKVAGRRRSGSDQAEDLREKGLLGCCVLDISLAQVQGTQHRCDIQAACRIWSIAAAHCC